MTGKKIFASIILVLTFTAIASAQKQDTNRKTKTGWNFGAVPVIAYDSDLGLKYGGLINLYNYGDGKEYPKYRQSIFLEWSRTTKGSGINKIFFDSDKILKKYPLRLTADVSYLTEKALDFYGFNGYQVHYNTELENDESDEYISRMYYRHERKMFRLTADFQGDITDNSFRWFGGIGFFDFKIGPVDIDRLNKGKTDNLLPDTVSLYDQYVDWGVLGENEATGGKVMMFKAGLIYDTRDNQPNPMKGIWSEAILIFAPDLWVNGAYSFTKLSISHRQYFTLIKDRLSFAGRLSYQGTIGGNAPFYIQPHLVVSYFPSTFNEGLGGAKNLRGIVRNRIVGNGVAFGNAEFRWKLWKGVVFKQNIYLGLNAFLDAGMVVDPIQLDESSIPAGYDLSYNKEKPHISYGMGLRFAMNENFIISLDFGLANDPRDGSKGLYIGTNNLY